MADHESAELLARWRAGDQQAATELVDRFTERLLALARGQLSEKLARRVDAEDVVQSAYRSFFAAARDGHFELRRRGDLWRLLSAITVHKLQHQVEFHTADKRSVDRETGFGGESSLRGLQAEVFSRAPSPVEAAALVDELEQLLRDLKPVHRQIVEMRLQGHSVHDIAVATDRSERLVRRVLEQVKGQLQQRAEGDPKP
jgi:RNA polymerase sigma-70 factor (ECF subfamily)